VEERWHLTKSPDPKSFTWQVRALEIEFAVTTDGHVVRLGKRSCHSGSRLQAHVTLCCLLNGGEDTGIIDTFTKACVWWCAFSLNLDTLIVG